MADELQDFETRVLERSKQVPVLVDFWAPWCGPCRVLGPVLERLAGQAAGRWELVKINTEEQEELAAAFDIASIPAVKLFVNGQVANEFVGALSEKEIRRFLENTLPSPNAKQLAEAQHLLGKGENDQARQLLEPLVRAEPGNFEARVLLAQALLSLDPERIPAVLEPVNADSDFAEKANALRTLARLAQLPSHPATLPPAGVREQYLVGAAALRAGDFAAALQAFIEVLEKDKRYDNEGAKQACKSLFQLLGREHPVAELFFRPFSSALHA